MNAVIVCDTCGEAMLVPAGSGESPRYCSSCGAFCDVSRVALADIQTRPTGSDAITSHESLVSAASKTKLDEDDDHPYQIHDDSGPTEPCYHCQKSLPRDAVICNYCGFHQETGELLQRVHEKVDNQWETGLPFRTRLTIFIAFQGVALAATAVVASVDGGLFKLLLSWMIGVALLAFVLGTYSRVNLTRSTQGHVRLKKTWRCCFIPLGETDIRWRQYEGATISQARQTDILDWVILFLLAPWGVIPAFVWWHYIIQPDQFDVVLTKDHGYPELLLYRGHNDALAKEMAAAIRDVTGWR